MNDGRRLKVYALNDPIVICERLRYVLLCKCSPMNIIRRQNHSLTVCYYHYGVILLPFPTFVISQ